MRIATPSSSCDGVGPLVARAGLGQSPSVSKRPCDDRYFGPGAWLARPGSRLVFLLGPLHGLPPLLPGFGLLPLALHRGLLVIRSLLHLLEEAVLEHPLLQGLERGLDLVVVNLDTHVPKLLVPLAPVNLEHRPGSSRCQHPVRGRPTQSAMPRGPGGLRPRRLPTR